MAFYFVFTTFHSLFRFSSEVKPEKRERKEEEKRQEKEIPPSVFLSRSPFPTCCKKKIQILQISLVFLSFFSFPISFIFPDFLPCVFRSNREIRNRNRQNEEEKKEGRVERRKEIREFENSRDLEKKKKG